MRIDQRYFKILWPLNRAVLYSTPNALKIASCGVL